MSFAESRVFLSCRSENGKSIWVLYGASAFLSLFLHIPMMLLLTERINFLAFLLWFCAVECARIVSFCMFVIWLRMPSFLFVLGTFALSPRLLLPSAMLCFAYSNAPLLVHLLIVILWIGLEIWAVRAGNRVPVKQVFTSWKRDGVLTQKDNGTWLFRPGGNLSKLIDKYSPSGTFMKRSNKYGLPLVLIAPSLFFISEGAGNNFELRTFILGCGCLWMGYFCLPVLAISHVSRRTLRALERGEIG